MDKLQSKGEEKFRILFKSINNPVFIFNARSGGIVDFNKKAERLMGYSREELLEMTEDELYPEDLLEKVKDDHKKHSYGEVEFTETEVLTKDKKRIPISISTSVMRLNNVEHTLSVFTDIRECKNAEEKYKALYDTSRDAIMTLAPPDWNFTSGNKSTIEMFQAKNEKDFVSRGPWEYSPEFQADGRPSTDAAKESIMTAMKEGSNFFEWTHKRLSGENFAATVLLTKVNFDGDEFLQATVRDITELKKYEDEVKKRIEELEEFHKLTVDREVKMIELKKELEELREKVKTANK